MININLQNHLQEIDLSLKDKSTREIYMIYIMLIAIIFFLVYILFWKSAEASYKNTLSKTTAIQNKINIDDLYLKANTTLMLKKLDKNIQDLKIDLALNNHNNSYIKNKIKDIPFLVYDEKIWGAYINSISVYANKNNIKILNFSNEIIKSNEVFEYMLNINLQSTGSYKNTLKFINSLEQSELIVDVHGIDILAKDKLITDLNISVWGINYNENNY